jgi:hypothetical protein
VYWYCRESLSRTLETGAGYLTLNSKIAFAGVGHIVSRVVSLITVCLISALAHAAALTKQTSPWWGHIAVPASDDFQGRLTGTPAYRKAAEYVAQSFQRAGLTPAGDQGLFQNVSLEIQTIQTDAGR